MSISYLYLLLAFTCALSFVLIQILLRKPWQPQRSGLQSLIRRDSPLENDLYHKYLIPLLVYEEEYPSFGNILGIVFQKFTLDQFLPEKGFQEALTYLRDSVFKKSTQPNQVEAMCLIVHTLIRDPDVEYACRPHLKSQVDRFLKEMERISLRALSD